nr:MAG TPA: ParA [Caudoviricetes sp.]
MTMIKRNVIAFLNMKGGVCKTTLCKEIAYTLSKQNKELKILVIDIDPQSNCTQSFYEKFGVVEGSDIQKYRKIKENLPSIENLFSKPYDMLENPNLENIICKLSENLHIIPSSLNTVFMERETTNGNDQTLLNFIKERKLKNEYSYIFIDCPPTYSFYTISALLASDFYLVPLIPDIYSLLGLDLLNEVVKKMNRKYRAILENNPIENMGIVFTKIPKTISRNMLNNIEEIQREFSDTYIFEEKFQESDKLANNKLETFILDRDDKNLKNNIILISNEFTERIGELNGE